MTGEKRRELLVKELRKARAPVSGTELARRSKVSRQVIVQDVALLRAAGYDLISTTRGYLLNEYPGVTRPVHVLHSGEDIRDELYTIVDLGGRVLDVFVEHGVYGTLRADLNVSSRRDVDEFIKRIDSGDARPLLRLTSGLHWHTVEAESEERLDLIQDALRTKGYLCRQP